MLTKFWESIGSNAAERWLDYLFSPAFLFWMGGAVLYVWKAGWQTVLEEAQKLNQFQQGGALLLILLTLIFSSVLMQAIRFPLLRLLEGYWFKPLNYVGRGIVALQKRGFQKNYAELRALASQQEESLDPQQRERLIELDTWAHWHPVKSSDLLPTSLGNILRARERSPERKYGLDAIVCWPRLWTLLPETMRDDLTNARASLDRLAELCFWGLLFLLWSFLTPWAIAISFLWMFAAYRMACQSAMAYGDLLEAAFDLYRFDLYRAMGWAPPENTQEEKILGKQLTEYLWRGTLQQPVAYQRKEN